MVDRRSCLQFIPGRFHSSEDTVSADSSRSTRRTFGLCEQRGIYAVLRQMYDGKVGVGQMWGLLGCRAIASNGAFEMGYKDMASDCLCIFTQHYDGIAIIAH